MKIVYTVSDIFLSVIRILFGFLFIQAGASKALGEQFGATSMLSFLESKREASFQFYLLFVDNLVLQVPLVFALLVVLGEIGLGLSLLFSKKIKLIGGLGIFMMMNFMFVKGQLPWQLGADQVFSLIILIIMITPLGKRWDLGKLISSKLKSKQDEAESSH